MMSRSCTRAQCGRVNVPALFLLICAGGAWGQPQGNPSRSTLTVGPDSDLYGVTSNGGKNGFGSVFKITPSGSLTTLHSFRGADGEGPCGLALGTDGNFYGATAGDRANQGATLFKIKPNGTGFQTLYRLGGSEDDGPIVGVIQGQDGSLYGTTSPSGYQGQGTVFKVKTDGTSFRTLHRFTISFSPAPITVIQGHDGALYGTADDTVFKLKADGTGFRTLHRFGEVGNFRRDFSGLETLHTSYRVRGTRGDTMPWYAI